MEHAATNPILEETEWSRRSDEIERLVDTTGWSYDDAARALGIENPDRVDGSRAVVEISRRAIEGIMEEEVRSFVCGDCGAEVQPGTKCAHIALSKIGNLYHHDHPVYHKVGKRPKGRR